MAHALCRPADRIATLDVLCGLVLLGLLIAQAFGPPGSFQPDNPLPLGAYHTELPAQFMVQLLVSGQFERLGSFLVGVGLFQYWQHVRLGGALQAGRYARRLLITLLWISLSLSLSLDSVDLLLEYTLLGLTLLYFLNQSVTSLLGWLLGLGILAMSVPSGVILLRSAGITLHSLPEGHFVSAWLVSDRSLSLGFSTTLSYEGLMLGGLLVGKLTWLPDDPRLRVRLSLLQVVILPAAFLFKGTWVVITLGLVSLPDRIADHKSVLLALSGFLGPLLLTGVYLLDIGVNIRSTSTRWIRWPARVGQMSLTNYALQSLLWPLLLYGYGLGKPPPLSVGLKALFVVGIFAVQLGLSWVWFRHHRQGPLEWLCFRCIDAKWGKSKDITPPKQ